MIITKDGGATFLSLKPEDCIVTHQHFLAVEYVDLCNGTTTLVTDLTPFDGAFIAVLVGLTIILLAHLVSMVYSKSWK